MREREGLVVFMVWDVKIGFVESIWVRRVVGSGCSVEM